jgi:hypothetical protein
VSGHGEINRLVRDLSAPREVSWLFLDLVGDRERDLVLLDAGVENLVVKKRGRLLLPDLVDEEQIALLTEIQRLANATEFADVNIAAGIAQNELLGSSLPRLNLTQTLDARPRSGGIEPATPLQWDVCRRSSAGRALHS